MSIFRNLARITRLLLTILLFGAALQYSSDAEARAGFGRSRGRSTPRSAPTYQQPQYSKPSPQGQPNRGGFARGLAGGIAGGFLGSMLFSSLGFAGNGLGGGGMGLLDILLLAGVAYFIFRWWRRRQLANSYAGAGATPFPMHKAPAAPYQASPIPNQAGGIPSYQSPVAAPSSLASDQALDMFYMVQGAWTRRDLTTVRSLLSEELYYELDRDIDSLKERGLINRLENISVRNVQVNPAWFEGSQELVSVTFTANLLDYTIDEKSGHVVEGSNHSPVKFEEQWTFAKPRDGVNWQLIGINPIN